MNKIFLLSVLLIATGCTLAPRKPTDVALIPDDCANRHAIIKWLDQLAQTPRATLQSQEDYEESVSAVKNRIWRIRYNCQPAR